jgi:hypothetical protein
MIAEKIRENFRRKNIFIATSEEISAEKYLFLPAQDFLNCVNSRKS